ncbi:MAG TPA: hypothetical protein EYP20_06480 [Aigarchaeota archaeon]|nr:hypothetical protein [Aigarchaeota archaeon]
MRSESYEEGLKEAKSLVQVFKLVRRIVEERLGLRRAGVEIALATLPPSREALTDPASNYIILNQNIIHALTQLTENETELKSYLFRRLLEEYLKTLGITQEEATNITKQLIKQTFQQNHPIQKYTTTKITELYPEITLTPHHKNQQTKIHILTEETDNDTPKYIA